MWATKENTVAAETTTISNPNEQAAAWLCDPSKWTAYCDTDKANYAIGGPSVEMYVKSYNQTHGDDALGCQYQTNDVPGYIYKVNNTIQNGGWYTNNDTLDYSMTYKSMYCGQNGNKTGAWWLASPSARGSKGVCGVTGNSARLDCEKREKRRRRRAARQRLQAAELSGLRKSTEAAAKYDSPRI